MSEVWQEGGAAPAGAQSEGPTAGEMLRKAREAAGLHVAALAVSLKVPVRKLEALEDNRWESLPDLVFVRALASSVCRTLKIDPQPVLERLPQTNRPRLVDDAEGINTPFRAPGDGAPPGVTDQLRKPVVMVVLAILFGALIIMFLPSRRGPAPAALPTVQSEPAPVPVMVPAPELPAVSSSAPPPAMASSAPTAMAPAAQAADALPTPAPSARVASESRPVAPAASAAAAPVARSAASASPESSAAAAAAIPASGVVVFRTRGPSWVEVTDAKGVVTLRRQMDSGESAGAAGTLPLRVTIGRVDNTDVQVRGKAFDLRPVSRDNVARFEVK